MVVHYCTYILHLPSIDNSDIIPTLTPKRIKEPFIPLFERECGSFSDDVDVVYLAYCKIFLIFLFKSFGR